MALRIDSGEFPSSKGLTRGDLDRVLGKWQTAIADMERGSEWLLKAIEEVDETRMWEWYWGGSYDFNESREAFIAKKLLLHFDVVEERLPAILDKFQKGDTIELDTKSGQTQKFAIKDIPASGDHGGDRKSKEYQSAKTKSSTMKTRGSTQATTRIARLKRDHPTIAERLEAGEFKSVSEAERAAGISRPKMSNLEKFQRAYFRLSIVDQAAAKEWFASL